MCRRGCSKHEKHTHHEDGNERGRLREEGPETVPAAKPADHRQPEEDIVHPGHDVGVHVAQTTGFRFGPDRAKGSGSRGQDKGIAKIRVVRKNGRSQIYPNYSGHTMRIGEGRQKLPSLPRAPRKTLTFIQRRLRKKHQRSATHQRSGSTSPRRGARHNPPEQLVNTTLEVCGRLVAHLIW